MHAKRILVIGSRDYDGPWKTVAWSGEFPYVADYDAVVVDLTSLDQETLSAICDTRTPNTGYATGFPRGGMSMRNQLRERMGDFQQLLKSGGDVYCIASEILESDLRCVNRDGGDDPLYTSLDWCPLRFRFKQRQGDTLAVHDEFFREYFSLVKKWTAVVAPEIDDSRLFGEPSLAGVILKVGNVAAGSYLLEVSPLATNRANEHVGVGIRWSGKISGLASAKSGTLAVLPPPSAASIEEAIETLCRAIGGRGHEDPPGWIPLVEVPGDSELEEKIDVLRTKAAELERERSRKAQLRTLLYESGDALERAVGEALGELGFDVHWPVGKREDLAIHWEGRDAYVEVKGKTKGFSLTDLRQLGHYLEDAQLDQRPVKGIFVGNHWRKRARAKRGDPFPQNVIAYAAKRSIALVTTTTLFDAICAVRRGHCESRVVVERLFEAEGVAALDR